MRRLRRAARQTTSITDPPSKNRHATDQDGGTTPNCVLMTSQVEPQIKVMMAKYSASRGVKRSAVAGPVVMPAARRGKAEAP